MKIKVNKDVEEKLKEFKEKIGMKKISSERLVNVLLEINIDKKLRGMKKD